MRDKDDWILEDTCSVRPKTSCSWAKCPYIVFGTEVPIEPPSKVVGVLRNSTPVICLRETDYFCIVTVCPDPGPILEVLGKELLWPEDLFAVFLSAFPCPLRVPPYAVDKNDATVSQYYSLMVSYNGCHLLDFCLPFAGCVTRVASISRAVRE